MPWARPLPVGFALFVKTPDCLPWTLADPYPELPALPVRLSLVTSLGLGFILIIVHCSGRSQGLRVIITLGLHQQPLRASTLAPQAAYFSLFVLMHSAPSLLAFVLALQTLVRTGSQDKYIPRKRLPTPGACLT